MTKLTARTILGWDAENWSLALRFWEPHIFNGSADCLELGCGPGGVSLWLASRGNFVICSDVQEPNTSVRQLHQLYGVSDFIKYQAIDARAIPYVEKFDIIIMKSVIGGVLSYYGDDGLHQVICEVQKALKPGGKLLFAENLEASPFHMLCRRKFLGRDAREWIYPKLNEMLEFLSPFSRIDYQTGGFLGAFGRREWQRTILAFADKALLPLLPESSHYIVAGVAQKTVI